MKNDKIIILFYVFFAISYVLTTIYIDNTIFRGDIPQSAADENKIIEIKMIEEVNMNKTRIFDTMSDIKNYPLMLPQNFISSKITSQNGNVTYAKVDVRDYNFESKDLVKQTVYPYEKRILEVLDGDAKGTTITQTFEGNDTFTKITTDAKLNLHGKLSSIIFFVKSSLESELDKKIMEIIDYARIQDNPYEKTVDDLYRNLLHRPADVGGLKLYTHYLEQGKMTKEDISNIIMQSDEYKAMHSIKSIDELSPETKSIINSLYLKILYRPADDEGLRYFGSLYEGGKMTKDDIRVTLTESDEYRQILPVKTIQELDNKTKETINDLYMEAYHSPADHDSVVFLGTLLENGNLTKDQIKDYLQKHLKH